MSKIELTNWGKDVYSYPNAYVEPETVEELVEIMRDKEKYPSPVRAIGSNHSTTACAVANGGTVVNMKNFNKILDIGEDTITAQATALYIDCAIALEKKGLQFFVNVELGNLTMGSACCGGTKDASMPDEFGQVCSYAMVIKMITPSGERVEFNSDDPKLLQIARSSYGLMGIVYETVFRVQKIRPMTIVHETYSLDKFNQRLPELAGRNQSMMLYLFPFQDQVTVEYRVYHEGNKFSRRWVWKVRNWVWKTFAPYYAYIMTKYIPWKRLRYGMIGLLNDVLQFVQNNVLEGKNTSPTAQMIRYPEESTNSKYTFSIWAFPEEEYPDILKAYYEFCKEYYRKTGYRCDMLNVGYRIAKDSSSLFSYSFDGTVLTLDPVSSGALGWDEFLRAYNEFCSQQNGIPLFNQTKWITPEQARKAFGARLDEFRGYLEQYDPENRLLNDYFRERIYQ